MKTTSILLLLGDVRERLEEAVNESTPVSWDSAKPELTPVYQGLSEALEDVCHAQTLVAVIDSHLQTQVKEAGHVALDGGC